MTDAEAQAFADEWIAGWNSHDVDRILAHYHDDVTLSTPFVARLLGREGIIAGKTELRSFWSRALARFPDLTFTLYGAYAGVQSLVLNYRSVNELAGAEVLRFDEHGQVIEVIAHYRPDARH